MINVYTGQLSPESSNMMEKMLLYVLYISEWFILSTCLLRQYHLVNERLNWTEAQTYCRQAYTDLATVTNAEEMTQISSLNSKITVWLGLYSEINWRWSDGFKGSGPEYRNWSTQFHPSYSVSARELCVAIPNVGQWRVVPCLVSYNFICYRGTQKDPEFVLGNEKKPWSDAQRFCRNNFTDLATMRNNTERQRVQSLVPSGNWMWTGLSLDPNVYWSDGSNFSFSYWDGYTNAINSAEVICGVAVLYKSRKWRFLPCDTKLPFVCQNISTPAAVKKQVVKLRLSPEDSSVNLNDETVKANLLKKLQRKLEANGVTGVTLKWKEQPDGKVFHKEGKSSHKKDRKKREL